MSKTAQVIKELRKQVGTKRKHIGEIILFNERKPQIHDIRKVLRDELGLTGMREIKGESDKWTPS